jgi:hypothetical protein
MSANMSLLGSEEESLDLARWIDESRFFDHPISELDGGTTEWLPEMSHSIPLPDLLMHDPSNSIYGTVFTSATGASTLNQEFHAPTDSVVSHDDQKEAEHEAILKPQTKRMGRPKVKLNDPQSIKEVNLRKLVSMLPVLKNSREGEHRSELLSKHIDTGKRQVLCQSRRRMRISKVA